MQKTAYEVRISDWSSDVCSSDLPGLHRRRQVPPRFAIGAGQQGDTGIEQLPGHVLAIEPRAAAAGERQRLAIHADREIQIIGRLHIDRKSVVSGKRVSVRVKLGGPRLL